MALIVPEQSQRPYRFGMTLLCIGALFNWLGLSDSYTEPVPAVRYIGVGLIAVGAALICLAMCCWMRAVRDPQYAREMHNRASATVQVINIAEPDPRSLEKPPDYSSVVDFPPSYEDAIKELDANKLLYACPVNKYEDPIKTVEETILIINQLSGTDLTNLQTNDNNGNVIQDKQTDSNEHKEETDKTHEATKESNKDATNSNVIIEKIDSKVSSNQNVHHSIVEIPESNCYSNSQPNANSEIQNSTSANVRVSPFIGVDANVSANASLVNNEVKSNSIASLLTKGFRSFRKSTPSLSSEGRRKSVGCDNGNTSAEENR